MDIKQEALGVAIDRLDSIANGLNIPMPDAMHVTALKDILPDIVKDLKEAFTDLTGENPWD